MAQRVDTAREVPRAFQTNDCKSVGTLGVKSNTFGVFARFSCHAAVPPLELQPLPVKEDAIASAGCRFGCGREYAIGCIEKGARKRKGRDQTGIEYQNLTPPLS
eukprot:9168209-Pyramimonas_sp.AAC.1